MIETALLLCLISLLSFLYLSYSFFTLFLDNKNKILIDANKWKDLCVFNTRIVWNLHWTITQSTSFLKPVYASNVKSTQSVNLIVSFCIFIRSHLTQLCIEISNTSLITLVVIPSVQHKGHKYTFYHTTPGGSPRQ